MSPAVHFDHGGRLVLNSLLHPLLAMSGPDAYLLVSVLCFGEAGLLIGFFIPGETAVVFGGVLAAEHHVDLVVMLVVVVCSAILGDSLGYVLGRYLGPFLLAHRPLRGRPGVERSRAFLERRGALAVFLGRFVSVFRALVPGIAGISEVPYLKFLVANAAGGIVWGIAYCLAGFELGKSYEAFLHDSGTGSLIVVCVVVVLLAALMIRRRVREHRELKAKRAAPESRPDRSTIEPDTVKLPVSPNNDRS